MFFNLIDMNEKSKITILSQLIIALAIFFGGVYVGASLEPQAPLENDAQQVSEHEQSVSLMIDYGEGDIVSFLDIPTQEGESLFDVIYSVTEENNLPLGFKDFGGELGVFIESINDVPEEPSDKWWQYWVNNKYGEIGVSSYEVKSGDIIELKFVEGHE